MLLTTATTSLSKGLLSLREMLHSTIDLENRNAWVVKCTLNIQVTTELEENVCLVKHLQTTHLSIPPGAHIQYTFPLLFFYKPNLWWPNGIGKPSLYNVGINVDVKGYGESDSWKYPFGFHKIEGTTDSVTGRRLFKVNGQPIFIRGDIDDPSKFLDGTRINIQGSMWDGFTNGKRDFIDGPCNIQNLEDFFKDSFYNYGFNLKVKEVSNPIWTYHKYIPYSNPGTVHDQIELYGKAMDLDDFCEKAQLVSYIQHDNDYDMGSIELVEIPSKKLHNYGLLQRIYRRFLIGGDGVNFAKTNGTDFGVAFFLHFSVHATKKDKQEGEATTINMSFEIRLPIDDYENYDEGSVNCVSIKNPEPPVLEEMANGIASELFEDLIKWPLPESENRHTKESNITEDRL
ncbi:hypothetical protein GIB67_027225 [Kingdonia uniflora]|uniref:Glycoside hydrolase family 2 immunoglobulin-like beta-sandwich domain-containing protein n=1 Tax=Kingdonia uniflora TaxID=39325 RepID=A0A7J7KYB1_9MAGN|nr:hypothetical protein GIB67_027225 [Kingdonia uniflora]